MATQSEKQALPVDMSNPVNYGYSQQQPQQCQQPQQYQQPQQPQPAQQPQPVQQTIYIQQVAMESRYDNYNKRLSIIFGIVMIVLVFATIVLNSASFYVQTERNLNDMFGNLMVIVMPSIICGTMIVISGSFAICAGKRRTKCLVIGNLVLGVIASVMTFLYACVVFGAILYDISPHNLRSSADKASLGINVVWFIIIIVIFIVTVWMTVLPCKVACCVRRTDNVNIAMVSPGMSTQPVVTYQNIPDTQNPPPYSE